MPVACSSPQPIGELMMLLLTTLHHGSSNKPICGGRIKPLLGGCGAVTIEKNIAKSSLVPSPQLDQDGDHVMGGYCRS
jgi:hypothetical protein